MIGFVGETQGIYLKRIFTGLGNGGIRLLMEFSLGKRTRSKGILEISNRGPDIVSGFGHYRS
jgi:hypothetical protein